MSDTNKELTALLVEARDQLPLAASCWNQDDDRELADRNVQHVLGLINRINEALSTPHPETPAPLRGEESAMWLPSMRDQGVQAPSHNGPRGEWYQHGYSWGWNDCLRRIQEERQSLAAPMPQSAGVTDEQIIDEARKTGERLANWEYANLIAFARSILALAPGLSGWQEIASAPKNRKVIVGYFNQLGKHRAVMASYYPAETLESEHTDSGWADEGWYEECESQSETIMPTDCEPTHWMPLPAAPGLAPHQPQPEGKPWDMKTAHEKAPELIAQLDEESERLTRYGGSGDALLNEAARVIEALTQPQPEPTSKGDETYQYAVNLATALWEKYWKESSPHWRPLDDVLGVLTQIDNMTSRLMHPDEYEKYAASQQREPQEAAEGKP